MKTRYQRVINSLVNLDQERAEVETYAEALASYITYELSGGDPQAKFPELHALLVTSPALQEICQMLRTTLTLERQGQLIAPPRPAQFDLTFLHSATSEVPVRQVLWEKVGDVYRLATQLTAELGERVVSLTNLDALLAPYHRLAPAPAGLQTRSLADAGPELREVQELPNPEQNRRITLHMGLTQGQKGTIMVQVEEMATGQPLKASVALRNTAGRLIERIPTGGDGTATFTDLAPNQYVIQIKENTNVWEFQLDLVPKRVA